VETVATEDHNAKHTKLDVELTLDALGVEDDDDVEGSEKSTSEAAPSPVPADKSPTNGVLGANSAVSAVSPTPAHGLFVSTASPMGELYLGGGLDGGESPAERIALTPVRKLPPGSGMRKVLFYCGCGCDCSDSYPVSFFLLLAVVIQSTELYS